MDQEREKLARETAERITDTMCSPTDPDEVYCPSVKTLTRAISAALEQWGDLRAEQVRRETVDLACAAVEEYDRPGGPVLFTADSERVVTRSEHIRRRAFAASQGGTT